MVTDTVSRILKMGYTAVVVDDGSADNSTELLRKSGAILIRHAVNMGQGAALQTGIEYACSKNARYIVTFDADGQHRVEDIPLLLEPLENNRADIVFGSRFLDSAPEGMPAARKTLVKIAVFFHAMMTGIRLTDAHNGLRAMTLQAAQLLNLKENRMAHATEFLLFVKRNNLRLTEVPVKIIYSAYSLEKGQNAGSVFRIFWDLFKHFIFE